MMARFGHTLHLCFREHYWVAYVAMIVGAVGIALSSLEWQPDVSAAFMAGYFELFGSIVVAMTLAHVLTIDQDEGTKEVLLTYPVSPLLLGVERLLAGGVLSVAPLLLAAGAMRWYLGAALDPVSIDQLQIGAILHDSAVSWLFLSGITLLAASLTENWLAGVFAGGLYWVTDLLSDGHFTGNAFLFARTFPANTLSPEINRQILLVVGIVLCASAVTLFGRNRKRW